jgi:nucleoid-associated protein YgaU
MEVKEVVALDEGKLTIGQAKASIVLQVKTQENKSSKRTTAYIVEMIPEGERAVPTTVLKVETHWERADGQASPEKPEQYEIPAYELANFIMTKGKKLSR